MATSRIVKVTGAAYGGSPTTIVGVRAFTYDIQYELAEGMSDGEIGPTTVDLVGMVSSGTITVDNSQQADPLLEAAASALIYQYNVAGGTARKMTWDSVTFTRVGPVTIQQEPGSGPTSAYQVGWRGVFAAADADIDDHVAVANDS